MGTTLTGTTPQDTYDSLIKVTDNGPLSGSLKKLTDGLGNDSALSLSTGAASIAGSLTVTNSAANAITLNRTTSSGSTLAVQVVGSTVGTLGSDAGGNGRFEIASVAGGASADAVQISRSGGVTAIFNSAGNVAFGTTSPTTRLTIDNSANVTTRAIDIVGNGSVAKGRLGVFSDAVYLSSNYYFDGGQNNDNAGVGQALIVVASASGSGSYLSFNTSAAGSTATTARARIDADGLKFGADTAAANALDDYEEGTWTMGVSFGGASVGVTFFVNTGTYTKIGRQVTVNGLVSLTSKGSSTGAATITGLPFTSGSGLSNSSVTAIALNNITFANQIVGRMGGASTSISLAELTELGVQTTITDADFANNSDVTISLTYFV
jgi:hypothetical protein